MKTLHLYPTEPRGFFGTFDSSYSHTLLVWQDQVLHDGNRLYVHPTESAARAAAGETKQADSKYPAWLRAEIATADAPDVQALARKIALVLRKAGCAPTQFSTSQEALEHITALITPLLQPAQP